MNKCKLCGAQFQFHYVDHTFSWWQSGHFLFKLCQQVAEKYSI